MSIRAILTIALLFCFHQVLTRHVALNVHLDLSAHISDDSNQLTDEMIRICMKETQLSMTELETFKANELLDLEPNESTQCFAHCMYEQMGLMKDGIFVDNDDVTEKSPSPEMNGDNSDFAVCRSIRGRSKCDTAYKIHQCIQKVKYGGGNRDQQQSSTQALYVDANNNGDDESSDNLNGQ